MSDSLAVSSLLLARGRDRLETAAAFWFIWFVVSLLLARGRDRLETNLTSRKLIWVVL